MKLLAKEDLRVGVPTWYTVPTPLEHGRTVVCDVLCTNGLILSDPRIIPEIVFAQLSADTMLMNFYLYDLLLSMKLNLKRTNA
ncbi:hypothetical protein D3C81_365270 [compost metagenome]